MKKFEVKMLDGNKIAIYQQEYLTISMTFIYRQLQGIQKNTIQLFWQVKWKI